MLRIFRTFLFITPFKLCMEFRISVRHTVCRSVQSVERKKTENANVSLRTFSRRKFDVRENFSAHLEIFFAFAFSTCSICQISEFENKIFFTWTLWFSSTCYQAQLYKITWNFIIFELAMRIICKNYEEIWGFCNR